MSQEQERDMLLDQILDLEKLQVNTLNSYKEFAKPIRINKMSFDLVDLLRNKYYGEKQLKELKNQYKNEPKAISALDNFEKLHTKYKKLKQKLSKMNSAYAF